MNYNLYLKSDGEIDLNIKNDKRTVCGIATFADILHESDEAVENNTEGNMPESTKIGFVGWIDYNQVLAMAYGVNMTQFPYLTMRDMSKALLELDYTLISQETVDAVGSVTNPNIRVLIHFGISSAWRNKGIGEQALKGIIKHMKGKFGYLVILNPVPAQCSDNPSAASFYKAQGVDFAGLDKDPEKAKWKFNAFLQRCGFRLFKNYDNVFVCNVDQAVPEQIMIKQPV